MKIPQMILAELRRLTATPMACIALAALCIVPLLYGGVYLWANQDPYERLDQVPVALVVLDDDIGKDVADQIIDDGSFDWHVVSEQQAQEGVEEGTYDFSLTFPATFTDDLMSAATNDPRTASIVLTTNDANSYLATTIGQQAVGRIQNQVREQVGEQAAERLLTSIQTIRGGMVTAADGAAQLDEGLASALTGAGTLANGTDQLAAGAAELESGAGTLNAGLGQLESATASLPAQTRQLADGAAQVAEGNAQIANVGSEAAAATQRIANHVPEARADIVQRLQELGLSDAEIARVMQPLDELGGHVTDGNAQVQNVNSELQRLSAGATEVAGGANTLANSTPALVSGIQDANAGSAALAAGATNLREGADQAADGASQLRDGLLQLSDGAGQLRSGLDDGVAQIPESNEEQISEQASAIASPVDVDNDTVTRAESYGEGIAPFFLALAAWLGIYALLLIVKPVSKRAVTALHQPVRVAFAAWLTPAMFGLLQMGALIGVVGAWLQFDIAHPLQTFGIMALASATFAAILVALNVWLGSVGQFMGLVLMVLQLVTAGGTFPWQTLPEPLTTIHHLMPMSYAVSALRQTMYGGSLDMAWTGTFTLLGFLVASFVLIAIGVGRMMNHRTMRDLQPSLIG